MRRTVAAVLAGCLVAPAVAQAGTYKVKVPIKPTWRLHLDGQRVKAKLVVAATSPSGVTVHTAVRFWLRG